MQLYSCGGYTKRALKASYLATYRVAKKRASSHNCGSVPASCQRIGSMYDWRERSKNIGHDPGVQQYCVTTHRYDVGNILATLISRMKNSEFYSLQVDESTDVANLANLLVYIRYLFEGTVKEDFLFCRPAQQEKKLLI